MVWLLLLPIRLVSCLVFGLLITLVQRLINY